MQRRKAANGVEFEMHVCVLGQECWCGAPVDTPCGQSATPSCWPMVSEALAVHPDQVEAARARAKRHGVSVEYMADGRAVLPDRNERRRLLRLEGFHDRQGGYGD